MSTADAWVLVCDARGVVREHAATGDGAPPVGSTLRDYFDPESGAKVDRFLEVVRTSGRALGWEVATRGGRGTRVLAGLLARGGLVVAAARDGGLLAGLLETHDSGDGGREAVRELRGLPSTERSALDELTSLNNELSMLQREVARANVELEAQRSWLWMILEGLQEAVVATDASGRVTFVNAAAESLLGASRSACTGRDVRVVVDLGPGTAALHRALTEGCTQALPDGPLHRSDGSVVSVQGTVSPLRGARERLEGLVVVLRDTTEAHRSRELQLETERLQVSRGIAAGIAHTVNNLLAAIMGGAEILATGRLQDTAAAVSGIRRSVQRAAELTERLLLFTEREVREARVLDLRDAVRASVEAAGPFAPGITVTTVLPEEPCPMMGDLGRLTVALSNVVVNAREALRGGTGKIDVSLASVEGGQLIRIRDDGEGMGPEVRARLFEPFFSTRFLGRGLGLAAARGILAAHGGTVRVESSPGQGTVVTLTLPKHVYPGA